MRTSFAGQGVAPNAVLTLSFAEPFAHASGRYAVMVGNEDVTAQFKLESATELHGMFSDAALPAGTMLLRVLVMDAGDALQLFAQAPLRVLARPDGGRRTQVKPGIVLGAKGQLWERHSDTTEPVPRANHVDTTLQLGVQADHRTSDWGLKSTQPGAERQPGLAYDRRTLFPPESVVIPKCADLLWQQRDTTAQAVNAWARNQAWQSPASRAVSARS